MPVSSMPPALLFTLPTTYDHKICGSEKHSCKSVVNNQIVYLEKSFSKYYLLLTHQIHSNLISDAFVVDISSCPIILKRKDLYLRIISPITRFYRV